MAIYGQDPANDPLNNLFSSAAGQIRSQNDLALQLKMRNTLIQNQLATEEQIEKRKFQRENVAEPTLAKGIMDALRQDSTVGNLTMPGIPIPEGAEKDISYQGLGMLSSLLAHRQQIMAQKSFELSYKIGQGEDISDPNWGITIGAKRIDPSSGTLKTLTEPMGISKVNTANKVWDFSKRMDNLHSLYGQAKDAGWTGSVMGNLSTLLGSFAPEANKELVDSGLADSLVSMQTESGITTGRIALAGISRAAAIQSRAPMTETQESDMYNNARLKVFNYMRGQLGIPVEKLQGKIPLTDTHGMSFETLPGHLSGGSYVGGQFVNPEAADQIRKTSGVSDAAKEAAKKWAR